MGCRFRGDWRQPRRSGDRRQQGPQGRIDTDVAAEHDLATVYETPEEIVEADLAGIVLVLCRRLPWLANAYDQVARLRLFLPGALMYGQGAWPGFTLDASFANCADALQYQATIGRRLWSVPNGLVGAGAGA
jgi:hypothetical protein